MLYFVSTLGNIQVLRNQEVPLVWENMTHDDASVETGVGGQAKYDVMMVFCGNALQQHHKTLWAIIL